MITTDTIDLCLNLFGAVKLDPSAPEFEKAALAFIKAKNELVEERARIEGGQPSPDMKTNSPEERELPEGQLFKAVAKATALQI